MRRSWWSDAINPAAPRVDSASEFMSVFAGCSLSPRERVRVRGNSGFDLRSRSTWNGVCPPRFSNVMDGRTVPSPSPRPSPPGRGRIALRWFEILQVLGYSYGFTTTREEAEIGIVAFERLAADDDCSLSLRVRGNRAGLPCSRFEWDSEGAPRISSGAGGRTVPFPSPQPSPRGRGRTFDAGGVGRTLDDYSSRHSKWRQVGRVTPCALVNSQHALCFVRGAQRTSRPSLAVRGAGEHSAPAARGGWFPTGNPGHTAHSLHWLNSLTLQPFNTSS